MTRDIVIDGLPYPVVIATDAAGMLPRLLEGACRSVAVVADSAVRARARAVADALRARGLAPIGVLELRGGETVKAPETLAALYAFLAEAGADRATCLVAVGGGTVTDVAGYAAATYMRGIPWAAVPTTVLGMADAAIGGKTGIDIAAGKNMVGAFWAPCAVVADVAALATLPARERMTGLAEAVKCAIIADPPLLDAIEKLSPDADTPRWMGVIARSARVKADIVAGDPRESGRRAVLNLGHTIGHAIEAASGYRVAHGEAVAVGLRAAGLLARAHGWTAADHARVLRALGSAGLPSYAGGMSAQAVIGWIARDKKSLDGRARFVLPFALGDVRTGIEVESARVRAAVETCLASPPEAELHG